MKEYSWIPKNERKKILLLGDDFRAPSGVGTMCKEIILNTVHRYNWVQIGAMIKHPDVGKILDTSQSIEEEMGVKDPSVFIYPSDGYGDIESLRAVMKRENPDAIMIFTDPRYWIWLFNNEREIRSMCPIIYYNIWDNLPYPMWNKPFYESCDGLFAISKQTKVINETVLGDRVRNKEIRYIPHGVSSKYFPISSESSDWEDFLKFRDSLRDNKEFVLLYNARNIGRKRTSDLMLAWRRFCEGIGKEAARKCKFVLHTDPIDNSGTDLIAVQKALCDPSYVNIDLLPDRFDTKQMNFMYNASDGVILGSAAEGWGLSITEAMLTGKMFIATVSGGMQDQMRFEDEEGNWFEPTVSYPSLHLDEPGRKHGNWCIPVFPGKGRSLVGSPTTPYIFDDRADIEDFAKAIRTLYDLGAEERAKKGLEGHDWAVSEEAGFTSKFMGNRMIEGIDAVLSKYEGRSRYEFFKIEEACTYVEDYNPMEYKI